MDEEKIGHVYLGLLWGACGIRGINVYMITTRLVWAVLWLEFKVERFFWWVAPLWPWLKLNIDRAHKSSGLASVGGPIRKYCGECISGFGMNISSTSITGAELWNLYQGLLLAWNLGIQKLQVDVDNKTIENQICRPNPHYQITCSIKELIQNN